VYRNALLDSGVIRSGINATLPERLGQLHRGLFLLASEHGADRIVVEVPTISGMYARQRSKARDAGSFGADAMTAMHHATGALLLTGQIMEIPTDTRRAAKVDKAAKTAWVVALWPELGDRKSNQDQRDAIYLGATALRDYAIDARRAA
jgi:Holliday junction resolvasome RuvABC endonuclease subunit